MQTEVTEYVIYKITLPGVSSYIGATKVGISERWRQHKARAKHQPEHPFYAAILANGPGAFELSILQRCYSWEEASELEYQQINAHGLDNLFNILPGGDYGMLVAGKYFWEQINQYPERKAAYIQKLCKAQQSRPQEAHAHLHPAGKKWRKENPKEAYRISRRGFRIATKKNTTTGIKQAIREAKERIPLKEKLLVKHKGRYLNRTRWVKRVWASRTKEEKAEIFEKISKSLKKLYAESPEAKEANSNQLVEARKHIDREKQVAAAKKGIALYWQKLRADPVKYNELMEKKRAKALANVERKRNEKAGV